MSAQSNPWSEQLKHAKKFGNDDPSPYGRAIQLAAETEERDRALEDKVYDITDLLREASLTDENPQVDATLAELAATLREAESKKKGSGRPAVLAHLKQAGVEKLSHRQALASALAKARNHGTLRPGGRKAAQSDAVETPTVAAAPAAAAPLATPSAAPSAAVEELEPIESGARVMILGLLSRPDLNGRFGVVSGFQAERGRYNVTYVGETIALRRENLKPAPLVT